MAHYNVQMLGKQSFRHSKASVEKPGLHCHMHSLNLIITQVASSLRCWRRCIIYIYQWSNSCCVITVAQGRPTTTSSLANPPPTIADHIGLMTTVSVESRSCSTVDMVSVEFGSWVHVLLPSPPWFNAWFLILPPHCSVLFLVIVHSCIYHTLWMSWWFNWSTNHKYSINQIWLIRSITVCYKWYCEDA